MERFRRRRFVSFEHILFPSSPYCYFVGHFKRENPWITVEDPVIPSLAEIVGAKPIEVAPMNTLTVDLHMLMVYDISSNRMS